MASTAPPLASLPVEGPANQYLTPDVARQIAQEIASAGGVEVFFVGRLDATGLVAEVESHAFGSRDAAPALLQLVQPGDVILHNHPSGQLLPSDADIAVSSIVGNNGGGSYIVNNDCTRVRVIVKPSVPKKIVPLDEGEVLDKLGAGSSLSRALEGFEDRPQQREMASAIARAFNTNGVVAIEAGTGTGKSLAYLVPAVLHALKNNERVVVSTHTINLQEQLMHKDLPALRLALGQDFTAELVKGRSNYVCKRKAQFAREEMDTLVEDDFRSELRSVLEWASTSPSGDRADLPAPPRMEVWERVESEADNCLRVRCPFYESCFFYNSRRRAARANVLVVNHSLLLSDLAVRRETENWTVAAVLPPYSRVVLDEAHHLEEIATSHFAAQTTRVGLRRLFARLYRLDRSHRRGVLATLLSDLEELVKRNAMAPNHPALLRLATEVVPLVADARDQCDFLLGDFAEQFMSLARLERPRGRVEHRVRLTPALLASEDWNTECLPILQGLKRQIATFQERCAEVLELFEKLPDEVRRRVTNPLMEWRSITGRLESTLRNVAAFSSETSSDCRWVELSEGMQGAVAVRLCSAPVSVAGTLREALHDRMKTEVLTSATLTVESQFRFYFGRIGLPPGIDPDEAADAGPVEFDEEGMPILAPGESMPARPVESVQLDSPFDFGQQVFLGIPTDLGDPRGQDFEKRFAELTTRAIAASDGRAFVLFTSYAQMNRAFERCAPAIRRLGYEVMRQGEESRDRLLRRFRADETSVLFATSSFWEGVDVKGRALELLILAKLPFAVPTEPIQEAQFEALRAAGRDPFDELVVPRAIIRFKQGFGRLIRARSDRGAVLIADERVLTMRYGQRFLRSLAGIRPVSAATEPLIASMAEFYRRVRAINP